MDSANHRISPARRETTLLQEFKKSIDNKGLDQHTLRICRNQKSEKAGRPALVSTRLPGSFLELFKYSDYSLNFKKHSLHCAFIYALVGNEPYAPAA